MPTNTTLKKKTVTIEKKRDSVEIDNRYRGNRVKISKYTQDRAFFIALHWEPLKWLEKTILSLLSAPLNKNFFKEERFAEQAIWVEKSINKKGTPAEIALLHNNGGINKILIPVGAERKGWDAFYKLIANYPSDPPLKAANHPKIKPHGTINKPTYLPKIPPPPPVLHKGSLLPTNQVTASFKDVLIAKDTSTVEPTAAQVPGRAP